MKNEDKKSKTGTLNRRDFLKALSAIGGAAVISSGCTPEPLDKLVSYAVPPDDVIPGIANYYTSVIPCSPVGTPVIVRVREGRAIKVEGNPLDPVTSGSTSAEDQATLQTLYDPDRVKQPLFRNNRDNLTAITYVAAVDILVENLKNKPKNAYIITNNTTATTDKLFNELAEKIGAKRIKYEPFSYENIKHANKLTYGKNLLPTYHIDKADYLLSIGADFLETWLSPSEYSKRFTKMHEFDGDKKSFFCQVEPKMTMTGSMADEWVPVKPFTNLALVLGIINYIKSNKLNKKPIPNVFEDLETYSLSRTSSITGINEESIIKIAKSFVSAPSAMAIGGGYANSSKDDYKTIVAINLLNEITGNSDKLDFDNYLQLSNCSKTSEITDFIDDASKGNVDFVFIYNANPVYSLPKSFNVKKAFEKIKFKVSGSMLDDETSELCDLVIPDLHAFEKWGDYEGKVGNYYIMQPVMKPLYKGSSIEQTLLNSLNRITDSEDEKISSYYAYLRNEWKKFNLGDSPFPIFWNKIVKDGGIYNNNQKYSSLSFNGDLKIKSSTFKSNTDKLNLYITPSYKFYDGRSSNNSWLQELPDLLTTAVWDSWVEINSKLAEKLDIKEGDFIEIESDGKTIVTQAYLTPAIRPDTISISMGQGHTKMGRYAQNRGVNPIDLLSIDLDSESGGLDLSSAQVTIKKTGNWEKFVKVQHSFSQENRDMVQVIPMEKLLHDDHHDDHHGEHHKEYDMYREYDYFIHKWGMTVDLDKCTGCGSCVVSCYAENNIPVVGKEQVANGRHMAWLTLERFQEEINDELNGTTRIDMRILPQMCQHCENAPCEPVCPVFATYHNPEGINLMVYSRCVGTRYCSNNCSYKVRRFNWFSYQWPEPLNLQLNPDVTVRAKGVMEKCNFCFHKIGIAKDKAKDEKRKMNYEEISTITACQTACGCGAIEFGDLNDPNAKVTKLSKDKRAYSLLGELNTRPTVTYLKKIRREQI